MKNEELKLKAKAQIIPMLFAQIDMWKDCEQKLSENEVILNAIKDVAAYYEVGQQDF